MIVETKIGNVFTKKVGTGPHLSFLHGFCETSAVWEPILAELSKNYTCVLIDIPGFGQSASLEVPEIKELATGMLQLHKDLGISESTVFGHSMGGYIALEMLNQDPSFFNGIGLIHSSASADSPETKDRRMKSIDFVQENRREAFLKPFTQNLVAESNYSELRDELWDLVSETPKASIIDGSRMMMHREDHTETLADSKVPCLFICGEEDSFFSPKQIYTQAAMLTWAMIHTFDGIGHLSMLENPEKCSEAILDFMETVDQWTTSNP